MHTFLTSWLPNICLHGQRLRGLVGDRLLAGQRIEAHSGKPAPSASKGARARGDPWRARESTGNIEEPRGSPQGQDWWQARRPYRLWAGGGMFAAVPTHSRDRASMSSWARWTDIFSVLVSRRS